MENLIFSLNATVPVFLMMLLGMLFRKLGWIDEAFASKMNQFVFLVPLPVLVFHDLAAADIGDVWNFRFVAFCFLVTAASIAICAALSCFLKEKAQRGEFIQASYRSSAALLGIALTTNIYGDAGLVPLMIIGSVPLYNIMAVVVLSLTSPAKDAPRKGLWKSTLKGIITNPIILGIAAGLLWSVLRLPFPPILEKTVFQPGRSGRPARAHRHGRHLPAGQGGGAGETRHRRIPHQACGLLRPLSSPRRRMGFREEELVAILIMLGSATTVSCYVMAKTWAMKARSPPAPSC